MSRANVEIARAALEAWSRGDLDAWAEADPEIEWYVLPDVPDPGPHRGRHVILERAALWRDMLALRPPGGDAEGVLGEVYVSKFRDGKVVELREYRTKAEASRRGPLGVADVAGERGDCAARLRALCRDRRPPLGGRRAGLRLGHVQVPRLAEQQTYEGVEGARVFLRDWLEAWDDWELEVEALHDAADKVVAIVRQRGQSKTSGLPVDMAFGQVWTIRDGKSARMEMYVRTPSKPSKL